MRSGKNVVVLLKSHKIDLKYSAAVSCGKHVLCLTLISKAYERRVEEVGLPRTRARQVTGAPEDESTHAKFFCNQAQN